MKTAALVYTLGGRLVPAVKAMREGRERIEMRSLRHFGVAESGVHAVFLEIDDSRIRESYESQGIPVTVLGLDAEKAEAAVVVVEAAQTTNPQEPSNVTNRRGRNRKA